MPSQAQLQQLFGEGQPLTEPSQEDLSQAFSSAAPLEVAPPPPAPPAPITSPFVREPDDSVLDQGDATVVTLPPTPRQQQDQVDEKTLGDYMRWIYAQPQQDPVKRARVLRAATLLTAQGVEQPDLKWVTENIDQLERNLRSTHINFAGIAKDHPVFARFATDPSTAPLVLDDAATLTGLDYWLTGRWSTERASIRGADGQELVGLDVPVLKTAPAPLRALRDSVMSIPLQARQAAEAMGTSDWELQIGPDVPGFIRSVRDPKIAEENRRAIEQARTEYAGKDYGDEGLERAVMAPFKLATLIAGDTGARLGGGTVGATVGGFLAGPPGAIIGGGVGQFLSSFGFNTVTTAGQLYEDLSQLEDANGERIDPEVARKFAWSGATVNGLLMAAGFDKVARAVPGVGQVLDRVGGEAVKRVLVDQTTRQLVQRAATQYGGHVLSGAALMAAQSAVTSGTVEATRSLGLGEEAHWGQVSEAAVEGFKTGFVDMLLLSAWAPGRQLLKDIGKAQASADGTARLEAAIGAAKGSKLLESSPEQFEAYVAKVKLEQGGIEDVRIPVEEFRRYWTEQKADPAEVAQALLGDGGKAYAEAVATGGDVAIPVERFLARLAKSGHAEGLLADARLSQDGLTARQRRAVQAELNGKVREYAAAAPDQMEPAARQVYEDVLAKATKAGVEHNVADANAKLVAATFRGWAEALSERAVALGEPRVTAMEVYARLAKLEIQGPKAAPADAKPSDRGSITFTPADGAGKPREFDLALLKGADRSTLAHETAHFLTEVMGDLATEAKAPERVRADYQQLLAFMGHGDHQERAAATAERLALSQKPDPTPEEKARLKALAAKEERVSYAWERYLAEGKTPSAELAGVFGRFKSWMTRIYKGPGGIEELYRAKYGEDLPVSRAVHQVFDRLLATEGELKKTAAAAEAQPFEPLLARMSPETRAEYERAVEAARGEAEQELLRRVVESERRETATWFKAERERVEGEVDAELDQDPVQRAVRYLKGGGLGKGELPATLIGEDGLPLKLDRAALVKQYGAEFVRTLPRGIFSEKGLPAEALANLLGWDSGDAMVRAMAAAEPRQVVVDREVQRRLAELYGPSLLEDPQALQEAALAASHNDAQAQKVLLELRELGRQLDPSAAVLARGVDPDALRRTAERILLEKPVGSIYPETYLRQERAAARRALDLAVRGKVAEAFDQKQAQALNMFLYRAARDVREELDKGFAHLVKTTRDSWRSDLGKASPAYRDGHDAILQAVGIAHLPEGAVRPSLEPMIQQTLADAQELDFDLATVRDLMARPRAWRELTVDQARTVLDAVTNVRRAANAKNEVILLDRTMTREDVIAEAQATAAAALPEASKPPRDPLTETWRRIVSTGVQHGDAILLTNETMAGWLDGGRRDGIFHRLFVDGYLAARNRKNELVGQFLSGIMDRWQKMPAELKERRFERLDLSKDLPLPADVAAELGEGPVTRANLWMIALNMGNRGNKERLLGGFGWSEGQVMRVLNERLTAAEWKWVQGVWDSLEELYPLISAVHEKETGLLPGKVVATPVETPHGTFRGGYFPAKYDPRVTKSIGLQQADSVVAGMFSPSYERAHTYTGHAKARAEHYQDVIDLDWGLVPGHVAQVIHDVSFRSYVKQTAGVLLDPRMGALLKTRLGEERAAQFIPWLKAVASAQADAVPSHLKKSAQFMGWLKNRLSVSVLGHNLAVAAGDLVNPAMAVAVGEVKGSFMTSALVKASTSWTDTRAFALENSPELRHRADNVNRHLSEQLKVIGTEAGMVPEKLRQLRQTAFWFMEQTDKVTATMIWQGRFQQGLAEGLTRAEAARAGDATVRKLFPAEEVAERAAVLRNPQWGALLLFYGFQNKVFNMRRDMAHRAWSVWKDPGATDGEKAKATGEWAFRWLASSIVIGTLGRYVSGQGPDKKESAAEYIARTALLVDADSLPLVGPTVESLVLGKKANVRAAPAVAVVQRAVEKIGAMRERAEKGDVASWDMAWDAADLLGLGLGVPTGQARKSGQYVQRLLTDETSARGPGDVAAGLVYGERPGRPANPLTGAQDLVSGPR